jgi:hypothetical protein
MGLLKTQVNTSISKMSLKSFSSKILAKYIVSKTNDWASKPVETQDNILKFLIKKAEKTEFGKKHHFSEIKSYKDFKENVPISDYEGLKEYILKAKDGEADVLWPGLPLYMSKTSGTTSGAKYIPLTKESLPYHIQAARNAILHYIFHSNNSNFVDGKMIFLQGSPELDKSSKIPIGRLSGIVAHYVPNYLQSNRLPSFKTNCIEDWEKKVDEVVEETIKEKMTLISGIPPWVQMYFERLIEKSDRNAIKDIFPEFSLFIYGGVNYEPYKQRMKSLIGKEVDSIELYPASEGFIAYQDNYKAKGMLLLLNSGIYYEFIEASKFYEENPPRINISEVELGVNYVLIVSTNAGLWGYNIGDTVKFVSLNPYRIIVTGRIKHFTSAFGEHVIAEEVEAAISYACKVSKTEVVEFHLAPEVSPKNNELPYHEWFIEFKTPPSGQKFKEELEKKMNDLNPYYKDLIHGKILQPLKITAIKSGGFNAYMKSQGKLGGQNKLPRLANDRKIADQLSPLSISV